VKAFRLLLLPFSLLYAIIIFLRNLFYDAGILPSTRFDIPIISVGNLAFGGTGKTPHIEYLIKLLSPEIKTAVLSRGYKRKTTGYIFADDTANADKIGDEPYQIFKKHKHEAAVAVSENRIIGIPNLLYDAQETQVVLLDDAFQHRAVKPGMNILLSDYNRMFTHDFIAPMGNLREYRNAYKRADAIVVTKCPEQLNQTKAKEIIESIKPYAHQKVYFSFQRYGELIRVYHKDNSYDNSNEFGVLLFAGIAQISSLDQYIKSQFKEVETIHFNDHQSYGDEELKRIIYGYEHLKSSQKIIITTEKDAVKLLSPELKEKLQDLPIFYQPLKTEFFSWCKSDFDAMVKEYVLTNLI
jgi:tetraacyldisaccharide 4'-kinase